MVFSVLSSLVICEEICNLINTHDGVHGKYAVIGTYEVIETVLKDLINMIPSACLDNLYLSNDYEYFTLSVSSDWDIEVSPLCDDECGNEFDIAYMLQSPDISASNYSCQIRWFDFDYK